MAMNWRQIETSREARLWIGQVIAPVVTLVVLASPETREKIGQTISNGASKVKNGVTKTYYKVKSKFSKKKETNNPCKGCYYEFKNVCASDCEFIKH